MTPARYSNAALTAVAELLLDEYGDLSPEQVANLAADLPGEWANVRDNRAEAAWAERTATDDTHYRRQMNEAGRGSLLR